MGWQEIATLVVVALAVFSIVVRVSGGWPFRRKKSGPDCGKSCDGCH